MSHRRHDFFKDSSIGPEDGFFDSDSSYAPRSPYSSPETPKVSEDSLDRPGTMPEDFGYGGVSEHLPSMPIELDVYANMDEPQIESTGKLNYEPQHESPGLSDLNAEYMRIDSAALENGMSDKSFSSEIMTNYSESHYGQPSAMPVLSQRSTRHGYKPKDQLGIGGQMETSRADDINHIRHEQYQRPTNKASLAKPRDNLRLEGQMENHRKTNEEMFQSVQRSGRVRPQDGLKLEGTLEMRRTSDSFSNHDYKEARSSRGKRPQDSIQLDKSTPIALTTDSRETFKSHAHETSRGDIRKGGTESTLKFEQTDGRTFGRTETSNAEYKKVALERRGKVKASDNFKVGEGKLELKTSSRTDFREVKAKPEELRAKPPWYKEPSVTIGGEQARNN